MHSACAKHDTQMKVVRISQNPVDSVPLGSTSNYKSKMLVPPKYMETDLHEGVKLPEVPGHQGRLRSGLVDRLIG